jgi:hypothetical protein
MLTSGIPVKDLEQEERDGGDRIELAMTPGIPRLATGTPNDFGAENPADVLTKSSQDSFGGCVHEEFDPVPGEVAF